MSDLTQDPEAQRFVEEIQSGIEECGIAVVLSNAQASTLNPCENFDMNIEYKIREVNPEFTPKPDGLTMA